MFRVCVPLMFAFLQRSAGRGGDSSVLMSCERFWIVTCVLFSGGPAEKMNGFRFGFVIDDLDV